MIAIMMRETVVIVIEMAGCVTSKVMVSPWYKEKVIERSVISVICAGCPHV